MLYMKIYKRKRTSEKKRLYCDKSSTLEKKFSITYLYKYLPVRSDLFYEPLTEQGCGNNKAFDINFYYVKLFIFTIKINAIIIIVLLFNFILF